MCICGRNQVKSEALYNYFMSLEFPKANWWIDGSIIILPNLKRTERISLCVNTQGYYRWSLVDSEGHGTLQDSCSGERTKHNVVVNLIENFYQDAFSMLKLSRLL